jgi:hypothetical protein
VLMQQWFGVTICFCVIRKKAVANNFLLENIRINNYGMGRRDSIKR